MKDEFESVVLADSSQGMIEVLKEKIKNEKLTHFNPVLTDNLTGAFSVEWFNIIYSLMTLHHVDDIGAIFKEFASVTKPCGFLAIGDLVTEDGSFHGLSSDFDGHRGFSKEELELHLIQSGFKLINYSIFFEIQTGNTGKELEYMVQWDRTHKILKPVSWWNSLFKELDYKGDFHYKILIPEDIK